MFHSAITLFHTFHLFSLCVMVWIISSHISFHALNFSLALFQWLFNLWVEFLISMTVFFIYRNSIFLKSAFFAPQGLVLSYVFNSFLSSSSFQLYLFYNLYLGVVLSAHHGWGDQIKLPIWLVDFYSWWFASLCTWVFDSNLDFEFMFSWVLSVETILGEGYIHPKRLFIELLDIPVPLLTWVHF